ncbi:glycosyltransferase [Vibrio furnissii]|uniref:glycosyltransferase n=1 Tax=Vibrio furnissii TaxID=29494 RepID=UPI001EEAEBB8|nr:glycosyltransferase [Vibrio furnissii]
MMGNIIYLFNATTNNIGGAVQNSVNFILNVVKNNDVDKWYFMLNREVAKQVCSHLPEDRYCVFDSPAKSIRSRLKIRKLEKDLKPNVVYTSAGPSYVRFRAKHVVGCSNPYVLGPSPEALTLLGGKLSTIKRNLHSLYQKLHFHSADHYILQTEPSLEEFVKLGFDKVSCSVVHNAISEQFLDSNLSHNDELPVKQDLSVFIPSSYYKHKALETIPLVARAIKESSNVKVIFYLTIKEEHFENHILPIIEDCNVGDSIVNLGPFEHSKAKELYTKYDIVLQPSVLEVFSTSYIEAISMNKPLIVPKLNFTEGICHTYPIYFKALDVDDCASKVLNARFFYESLDGYETSRDIVQKYGSQESRYFKIMELLNSIGGGGD